MTLSCSPEISAVTNTITATPTEMPTRISRVCARPWRRKRRAMLDSIHIGSVERHRQFAVARHARLCGGGGRGLELEADAVAVVRQRVDRKSTRLNSSHVKISYA